MPGATTRRRLQARTQKAWEQVKAMPEVRLRTVNLRSPAGARSHHGDLQRDLGRQVGLRAHHRRRARQDGGRSALIIDPEMAFIAEVDGKPAGMCICVPNLNEVIGDLSGKLFPFGWAKLIYGTKVQTSVVRPADPPRRARGDPQEREALRLSLGGHVRGSREARHRPRVTNGPSSRGRAKTTRQSTSVSARWARGLQDVSRVRETARLTTVVPRRQSTTRDEHARTKSAAGISLPPTSIPRTATEDERAGIWRPS